MIQFNSKKIKPGDTFICLPGGDRFIKDAYARGAVSHHVMDRHALAAFAKAYFGNPSQKLKVIGVTGTNGKTTVVHLITEVLHQSGKKVASSGTISHPLTTPESFDLQAEMAEHLKAGGTHFVMEVSSHAIHQGRVDGIDFNYKVLTNVTQDHLDYHRQFDHYLATKYRFMNQSPGEGIWPQDYEGCSAGKASRLAGSFNRQNLDAALYTLRKLGCSTTDCNRLFKVSAPPGRFETIDQGQDFVAIVDYAHTPDGLIHALTAAREVAKAQRGRLGVVFGCGGDRDKTKRAPMGQAAEKWADYIILTNDNPRSEDPQNIANDVLAGLKNPERVSVCLDRRKAIQQAIHLAKPRDVLLFAGKGHEKTQIDQQGSHLFDERDEVRLALDSLR